MNKLPDSLAMGAVTLKVANPDAVLPFYRDGVGLQVLAENKSSWVLGGAMAATLVIEHAPELRYAGPSEAGLFHTAILFPTQADLATSVASVARNFPGAFTGSADHLVSEAFYFDDPEGNGVELYWDRARTEWSWQHGRVEMATLALDPNAYLDTHLNPNRQAADAARHSVVGHVHLSVGNIPQAQQFYSDVLGFDVTLNWGGAALFVSAGGYHHHLAMNIWRSRGAGRRQQTLGLGELSIRLGGADELAAVADRLKFAGISGVQTEGGFLAEDPWGNAVRIEVEAN